MKNHSLPLISVSLLLIVLLSIILYFVATRENKEKYRRLFLGTFTLFLTMVGFFLTIGNEYFSQFDYKPDKIVKELFFHKDTLSFSEIKVDLDARPPHYYYIMDVSGSMKQVGEKKLTEHIEKKIDQINNSAKGQVNKWGFGVNRDNQTIEFYRLLQVRLMHSILKQSEKHKDSFKYSVVLFSENPEEITDSSKEISTVFKEIYEKPYKGPKTDFISLLRYLNENILSNASHADKYEPVEYYFILLSDNLHDSNHKQNTIDVEQKILDYLWEMHEKTANLRFYYLDEVTGRNGFSVDHLFKSVFPKSPIGVLDNNDELYCPIVSKKPISFFYTNSLFEECLSTYFTFDGLKKKREFTVGLGAWDTEIESLDEMKQEYYLIEGTDTIHLSRNRQRVKVDNNDKVEFMIKGYIPAPYKSPDIIIQDEKEDVRYIIPVTFYKNFPASGYLLLSCLLVGIGLFILLLIVYLIKEIYLRINSDEIILTR